jgi:CubicO group peptidase (beta-lactamase class C family)
MRPLEIPDTSWNISYGKSHSVADMSLYAFGSGAIYIAKASARIGELMLNKGAWKGKNLIDPELIDQIFAINTNTQDIVSDNHGWPSLPADAFAALGGRHQITLVVPSLDLIVVRYGKSFHGDDNIYQGDIYTTALDEKFFKPLNDCIIGPNPRMTQ